MAYVIKGRHTGEYAATFGMGTTESQHKAARIVSKEHAEEWALKHGWVRGQFRIVRLVKRPKNAAKATEHVVEVREEGGQYPWHRIYINGHPIDAYTRADTANEIADRIRRALEEGPAK